MTTNEENLEKGLIPSDFSDHHRVRNIYRRRLALGRALTVEKHNNRLLKEEIVKINKNITALEKERRESLLIGIKFKQLIENVNTAKNVNELL